MGLDLVVLRFRIEERFGVSISAGQMTKMARLNDPPDIAVGQLFDAVCAGTGTEGSLYDPEVDGAQALWLMFRREISDALGVDPDDITRDRMLLHDFGAS
jgi:hypothetical protein